MDDELSNFAGGHRRCDGGGWPFSVSLLVRSSGAGVFPWATFGVNLAGCLLMGLLIGWLWRLPPGTSEAVRLFGGVGVLGALRHFPPFRWNCFSLLNAAIYGPR